MSTELLCNGKYRLLQRPEVFPLTTDSMLLGDFARLRKDERVLELGCGSGVLALLLAGKGLPFRYVGLDSSEAACALARENLRRNGLTGEILQGSIQALPAGLRERPFDLVLSNPPYFPPDQGKPGQAARTGCTPEELCRAAGQCLREKGRFALVYPCRLLPRIFRAMEANRIAPRRLRLVSHSSEKAPKLALIEGCKGGGSELNVLPALNLYQSDGTPSPEYRRIYHMNDP